MADLSPTRHAAAGDGPKSQRTRSVILDTAMQLFAEIGYYRARNAVIAEAARLTPGALLYHFPTREALVSAAIGHIEGKRAELIEEAARYAPRGDERTDAAIDAYWRLLHEAPFVAFAELEAAARTDPMLRRQLKHAQNSFDRASTSEHMFDLVQGGMTPRLLASRDLARFVLEGLARANMAEDSEVRTERLLKIVKRAVRVLNRKEAAAELWSEI